MKGTGSYDLLDVKIEMRMASKQIQKEAVRAANSEKADKKKVANVIYCLNYRP